MQLVFEGQLQTFIPIRDFRTTHDLPDYFGIALFESKDYTGLASIEKATPELKHLREHVLAAVPQRLVLPQLLPLFEELRQIFEDELRAINRQVGLREAELDFAVAGFTAINQLMMDNLFRSRAMKQAPSSFSTVYNQWLYESVRVARRMFPYEHHAETWQIQIVRHAFGRVGLIIQTATVTYYVQDGRFACPAQGFMLRLCAELASAIQDSLRH